MRRNIKEDIPTKYIISVYEDLLIDIWNRVSNMIGGITLEVLFTSALKRQSALYPFLEKIEVSVNGISLDALKSISDQIPPGDVKTAFQNLVSELFALFAAMCGDVLIKELSPKLKEAENKLHFLYDK